MGNRSAKHILKDETWERSTYYLLDAQGNQVSIYEHRVINNTAQFNLEENNIYGTSRVGSKHSNLNVLNTSITQNYVHQLGYKNYEFTNHLGNVLTVFSDLKIPKDRDNNNVVDEYEIGIVSTADYSPFGVELDGRSMRSEGYRYGFQNQEKDDEIKGNGNSVNYKYRMHDPRVGRFFAVDPLASKYPWNSTYAFSENRVIDRIEFEGLEAWPVEHHWDPYFIKKYNAHIKVRAEQYIKDKVEMTCEDFALSTLIDFAKENKLPLTLTNKTNFGTESLNQENYNSFSEFKSDVLENSGAADIALNAKKVGSKESGFMKAESGQIVLMGYGSGISHAQMIYMNQTTDKQRIYIYQGNTNENHEGTALEKGMWNANTNTYYNFNSKQLTKDAFNFFKPLNIYEWDFQKFNDNSIDSDGKGSIIGPVDSPIPQPNIQTNGVDSKV